MKPLNGPVFSALFKGVGDAKEKSSMGSGTKISCYIRTLNEERRIGDVVKAAFQVAEEVIVIDSHSTDKTREIAAQQGAIVIEQKWLGLGRQKRFAEEHCKNNWLLDLDADEIVTPELAAEIKQLFAHGKPEHSIYKIPLFIAPPVGGVWTRSYIRPHTKLYDKRVVRIPDHEVWDHFKIPQNVSVGKLKGGIIHYAFANLSALISKVNFWTDTKLLKPQPKKKIYMAFFRLFFAFPFYFLRQYFLRNLWRAGIYGFIFAVISAFGRWLNDAKQIEKYLMERQRKERKK